MKTINFSKWVASHGTSISGGHRMQLLQAVWSFYKVLRLPSSALPATPQLEQQIYSRQEVAAFPLPHRRLLLWVRQKCLIELPLSSPWRTAPRVRQQWRKGGGSRRRGDEETPHTRTMPAYLQHSPVGSSSMGNNLQRRESRTPRPLLFPFQTH